MGFSLAGGLAGAGAAVERGAQSMLESELAEQRQTRLAELQQRLSDASAEKRVRLEQTVRREDIDYGDERVAKKVADADKATESEVQNRLKPQTDAADNVQQPPPVTAKERGLIRARILADRNLPDHARFAQDQALNDVSRSEQEANSDRRTGQQLSHAETMQRLQQDFQRAENDKNRTHSERMHAASMGQSMRIAMMNRPIQQDGQGQFFYMDENRKPVFLRDPMRDGEIMSGPKDLPASQKVLAEGIIKQISVVAADAMMDPATKRSTVETLNGELRAILGGSAPVKQPSVEDIAGLKARKDNPAAVQAFERVYGPGSAAAALGQGQTPRAAGTAGQPAQAAAKPEPGSTAAQIAESRRDQMGSAPGSQADQFRQRQDEVRAGLVRQAKARAEFESDMRAMPPADLIEKYAPLREGLTMTQQANLRRAEHLTNRPATPQGYYTPWQRPGSAQGEGK